MALADVSTHSLHTILFLSEPETDSSNPPSPVLSRQRLRAVARVSRFTSGHYFQQKVCLSVCLSVCLYVCLTFCTLVLHLCAYFWNLSRANKQMIYFWGNVQRKYDFYTIFPSQIHHFPLCIGTQEIGQYTLKYAN